MKQTTPPVQIKFVMQSLETDTEYLRRASLIVLRVFECAKNQSFFRILNGGSDRELNQIAFRRGWFRDGGTSERFYGRFCN